MLRHFTDIGELMKSRHEQVSFDVRLKLTEGIVSRNFLGNLFHSIAEAKKGYILHKLEEKHTDHLTRCRASDGDTGPTLGQRPGPLRQ